MSYTIYLQYATYNRMNTQNKAVHYTKILNNSMKMHSQCGEILCFIFSVFIQMQFLPWCCEVNSFFSRNNVLVNQL